MQGSETMRLQANKNNVFQIYPCIIEYFRTYNTQDLYEITLVYYSLGSEWILQ